MRAKITIVMHPKRMRLTSSMGAVDLATSLVEFWELPLSSKIIKITAECLISIIKLSQTFRPALIHLALLLERDSNNRQTQLSNNLQRRPSLYLIWLLLLSKCSNQTTLKVGDSKIRMVA